MVRQLDVCPVCGAEFDASRYQIVISALRDDRFDRIECADTAFANRQREQAELLARRRRRRA